MRSRIVVIEDEAELLQLVRGVLVEEGFDVIALSWPDLIAPRASGLRPDLFLIDLMLPGTSGVELAQQLRKQGFADTPMIAMSASDLMVRLAAESQLFQAILAKPFELSALLASVRRYAARG